MKCDVRLGWLVDAAVGDGDKVAAAANDAQPPAELASGWSETLLHAEGLCVFRAAPRRRPESLERLLRAGEFRIDFPEPTLVAEVVHAAAVHEREPIPGGEPVHPPGATFFRHASNRHAIAPIAGDSAGDLTGIAITDGVLRGLLGERLAEQLLTGLGLNPEPIARIVAIPPHVSAPLRALAASELDGTLMSVFARAKALEYLCALVVHVTLTGIQPRLARKRDMVRRLHDELTHFEGKVPTLGELARQCAISPKTLNEEFVKAFGQSIHAYMNECRLREAHAALQESAVPMKVLAERLGYSHVNNFISAFHKRFGYSPGSLRRGRRADDA